MKLTGWEGRLITFLDTVKASAFEPSLNDCALFSANGVFEMTGVDIAKRYRGKYKTIKRGLAMLRRHGFADHVAYYASHFEEHKSVLMAQRGDLAVVEQDGMTAIGIVQGAKIYVMTLNGLGLVPLTMATRAFKV